MGVFFYNTLMPTYLKMDTLNCVLSFKHQSQFFDNCFDLKLSKSVLHLPVSKVSVIKREEGTLLSVAGKIVGRRGIVEQSREWATCPSEPRGQVHLLLIILPFS